MEHMAFGEQIDNTVSEYLERMAPVQSHENRHKFLEAAAILRGVDLGKGDISVMIPLSYDEKLVGHAHLLITPREADDPGVFVDFVGLRPRTADL